MQLIEKLRNFAQLETCPVNGQCAPGFVSGAYEGWGWARNRVSQILAENPVEKSGVPHNAICLFRDGNKMCAVFGDFINLQESPAGFGDDYQQAIADLNKHLPHMHVAGDGDDIDTCKRCGRDIRNEVHLRAS